MLTEKGVEVLRRVKAHILEEPKRLNMSIWLDKARDAHDKTRDAYAKYLGEYEFPVCNTVGCIAGWTLTLETPEAIAEVINTARGTAIIEASVKILFDEGDLHHRLYYPDRWDILGAEYANSKTPKEKAEITARYIDYFIETYGPPKQETSDAATEERTAELVGA